MGTFTRTGTFRDRAEFLSALRAKVGRLKDGTLRGFTDRWEEGAATKVTLSGFGAALVFTVNNGDWSCTADIPPYLPVPQPLIEQKFDKEFEELKGF